MKKLSVRLTALALVLITLMSMLPVSIFASEATATADDTMKLSVASTTGLPGNEVKVTISLTNNPGIMSLKFDVKYDEVLTLTNVEFSSEFGGYVTAETPYKNPQILSFMSSSEVSADGTFATLTFKISEDAEDNYAAIISVTYDPDDVFDSNLDNVDMAVVNGGVMIYHGIPGDIDSNGSTNLKDAILLFRHIAGGDIDVDSAALDVNGDNKINNKDAVTLLKYVTGWPDIQIFRGEICTHELVHYDRVEATCPDSGNIEYWYCKLCDRYYTNEAGTEQIYKEDTVLEAIGHNKVIIAGKYPTTNESGYTESIECSICGMVLVPPQVIEPIKENQVYVSYDIAGSDEYLQKFVANKTIEGIKLHENPGVIDTADKGFEFLNISQTAIPGYKFKGWYDVYGNAVSSVAQYKTGVVELEAKWEKSVYTVMYDSELIPVSNDTYTVDTGLVLATPKLDGYIFAGWSDNEGNVVKSIPAGTTDHKTYKANWLSERNLAWGKNTLDEPIVYEDDSVILFTYEIGQIRNVPLYEVYNFGKILSNGVTKTRTEKYSMTTSETLMESYAEMITKATTSSFGWTLSSGWSDSTTIDKEWLQENEMTEEQAKKIGRNQTNNWYISSGSSGTDTTVTVDNTEDYNLTTQTKNEKIYNTTDKTTRQDFSVGLSANYKQGVGFSLSEEDEESGKEEGASAGYEINAGIDVKYSNGVTTNKKTGSDKEINEETQSGSINYKGTTKTNSDSWNMESGSSSSYSVSQEDYYSRIISEKISTKLGYGKNYILSGDESKTQGFTETDEVSNEYSKAVTYSLITQTEVEETFTTENTMSGFHRWVKAGTAHVFGVIGYDIEKEAYFVYTFSVMDDHVYDYEDYSYSSANYDDNQNGVISFVAPTDIMGYVAERVCKSEGLTVNGDGIVTAYSGESEVVIIPEYTVIKNPIDNSSKVIKVVGISENAFKGNNNITIVELSDFITEIPANAFSNCGFLLSVEGKSVTTIGDAAFAGCTSLTVCSLGDNIVSLGTNVFDGMDTISISASNINVVNAIIKSGAKNIRVDIAESCDTLNNIELVIPNTVDTFVFNGNGKEYTNVRIVSNAQKQTIISRATFKSTGLTPLKINSPQIELYEVISESSNLALIIGCNTAELSLFGKSRIISTDGRKAMVCGNISINRISNEYESELVVDGDILVCGNIDDNGYLTITNDGKIEYIDSTEFKNYLEGVFSIIFESNGGLLSENSKVVVWGSEIGSLPTPTKDYYRFLGWFTQDDEHITADTVFKYSEDITIYAKWTEKEIKGWVNISDLPAGAQVVNTKWTYTRTQQQESTASSIDGWSRIGNYWREIGRGNTYYATFPSGYDTNNTYYQTFARAPYTAYDNGSTKREVSNSWAGYIYWHWMYNVAYSTRTDRTISHRYGAWDVYGNYSASAPVYKYFTAIASTVDCPYLSKGYCCSQNLSSYNCVNIITNTTNVGTPRMFRFDYYATSYVDYQMIYQYQRITNEESFTEISNGGEISNVQKLVQYREK